VNSANSGLLIDQKPLRAFTQGDTHGRILAYCECLRTGTKLVTEALVNRRDIDWVVPINLFKYPWVRQLLKENNEKGAPTSAFDNWVTGKLFGYSDIEIAKFLREKGLIDAVSK
jgi:hypothetical protein